MIDTNNTLLLATNKANSDLPFPGHLVMQVSLSLHTLQAKKLVTGILTQKGYVGLWSFAKAMGKIWEATKQDDPYADWWLLKVYDLLKRVESYLQQKASVLRNILHNNSALIIHKAESSKSIVIPLKFKTPYGYLAAQMIGAFDKLARDLFTAKELGLQSVHMFNQEIKQAMRQILQVFNKSFQWQQFNLTRADVMAMTENIIKAQEKLGQLPEVIFTKKLRSPLAPYINDFK